MNTLLQEQRDALEKDKATAWSLRDAKHFQEGQKFKEKLDEALRKLEQKTADELGEGAHLDLLEELKDHFKGDRIRRVPEGAPGADIIHEIVEHGKVCGKIVYDSKNRNAWRSEYATKLCEDKIAEGADHAILAQVSRRREATRRPRRRHPRQSRAGDGHRRSLARRHRARAQSAPWQQGTRKEDGRLYAYITGERFRQHLGSIEAQADRLLDVGVAEERAHRKVWETRGGLIKTLQKAQGNLRAYVARIIGTRDAAE